MIVREIPAGGRIPRGYGVAYAKLHHDVVICYPLPLNWLIGWVRMAYFRLARGPRDRYLARLERAVRERNRVDLRRAAEQAEIYARGEAARRVRTVQFQLAPLDDGATEDERRDLEVGDRILKMTVERVREAFARAVERA